MGFTMGNIVTKVTARTLIKSTGSTSFTPVQMLARLKASWLFAAASHLFFARSKFEKAFQECLTPCRNDASSKLPEHFARENRCGVGCSFTLALRRNGGRFFRPYSHVKPHPTTRTKTTEAKNFRRGE